MNSQAFVWKRRQDGSAPDQMTLSVFGAQSIAEATPTALGAAGDTACIESPDHERAFIASADAGEQSSAELSRKTPRKWLVMVGDGW